MSNLFGVETQHVASQKPVLLEFFAYETIGMTPAQINPQLREKGDCDRYRDDNGVKWEPPEAWGMTAVEVFEFLKGLPLTNLVLAYVMGLNPSTVRIVRSGVTLNCVHGRVTIWVDEDDVVQKIEQEIRLGYDCGANVELALQEAKEKHGCTLSPP